MDSQQVQIITTALRQIRDQVGQILRKSPDCGGPAGEIISALGRIEDAAFDAIPIYARSAVGTEAPENRRRNKPKRYRCEVVGGNNVLAEYRDDNPIPLRADSEVIQAVADILSKSDKAMHFGAIQTQLGKRLGAEPAEYEARIALRFLQSPGVNLVSRRNARYQAVNARKIKRAAKEAWSSLLH